MRRPPLTTVVQREERKKKSPVSSAHLYLKCSFTVDSLWRLRQHLSASSISQSPRFEMAISQNER